MLPGMGRGSCLLNVDRWDEHEKLKTEEIDWESLLYNVHICVKMGIDRVGTFFVFCFTVTIIINVGEPEKQEI